MEEFKHLADTYELLFSSQNGQTVLDDLRRMFMDRLSYVKGDVNETLVNEGCRKAILYILNMMAISKSNVNLISDSEGELE